MSTDLSPKCPGNVPPQNKIKKQKKKKDIEEEEGDIE